MYQRHLYACHAHGLGGTVLLGGSPAKHLSHPDGSLMEETNKRKVARKSMGRVGLQGLLGTSSSAYDTPIILTLLLKLSP